MGRHRGNAEARLINAARAMLPQTGVSGLKVRQVVARAGVPLGAFHYYFRSRHEFCRRVLTSMYDERMAQFDAMISAPVTGSPVRRLREMLKRMAGYAREDRAQALALLRDILNGDPDAIAFMRAQIPLHMQKAVAVIGECQKAGLIRRMPVPIVMSVLGATIMSASMEIAMMERLGGGHPLGPVARQVLLSDKHMDERIDMAIRALAPDGASAHR